MTDGSGIGEGHDDLKGFLDDLRQANDLVEIEEEMSPRFEIGAILWELGEREGPAALFNRVAGFPGKIVVGNLMGHRRRLAKALGVQEAELTAAYLERKTRRVAPVRLEEAPVKQVHVAVDDVDLLKILPALIYHERDTSSYLTCAVTFARDPETGQQSMGLHRIQVRSEKELAICLATPPLAGFLHKAWEMDKPLEVAVAIGTDPAVLIAAVTWCPEGDDKIEIAGALRDRPVQLVDCEKVNLRVPANSQYIIEGSIQPQNMAREGVFGESSGIYVEEVESPLINVHHISHRKTPFYQALQTWSSEDDALFNLCFGSDILENVQRDYPFVLNLHIVSGTVGGHAVVSVTDCSAPMLRSAMVAILIRSPFVKKVIVVDDDIDIRNSREVEWAMATRFQADRDLLIINAVQGSVIDPSTLHDGSTCKVGMDATFPKVRAKSFEKIRIPEESRRRAAGIADKIFSGSLWEAIREQADSSLQTPLSIRRWGADASRPSKKD